MNYLHTLLNLSSSYKQILPVFNKIKSPLWLQAVWSCGTFLNFVQKMKNNELSILCGGLLSLLSILTFYYLLYNLGVSQKTYLAKAFISFMQCKIVKKKKEKKRKVKSLWMKTLKLCCFCSHLLDHVTPSANHNLSLKTSNKTWIFSFSSSLVAEYFCWCEQDFSMCYLKGIWCYFGQLCQGESQACSNARWQHVPMSFISRASQTARQ